VSINFTVDTVPPSLVCETIENKTYNTNEVPLNFTVSKPSTIMYYLDGVNTTISENTTLTGLSDGEHNLIIYAEDISGNVGNTELIQFSIMTATPTPPITPSSSSTPISTMEPTSTPKQTTGFLGTSLPAAYGYAILAVLVIIVVAGLSLVYIKKLRKLKA
jgi:hypothetical protein